MDFLRLPKEIIMIIIKKLDTKSILSLYSTCTYLQHLVGTHNLVKSCKFSLNTLATAQSLKLDFIKNISGHLQELDLCAVSDLSKTALLPAVKGMKVLKTLNVAYTNITLQDFIELYKVCPSIKNVAINFQFEKTKLKMTTETLSSCQETFRNIENVHFVGAYIDLLVTGAAPYILEKASLNSLTYTIVEKLYSSSSYCSSMTRKCEKLKYKNINVFILSEEPKSGYYKKSVFSLLDLEKYEYIIITVFKTTTSPKLNTYKLYASKIFQNFFSNMLGIDVEYDLNSVNAFKGSIVIMLWNKEYVIFDDLFYKKIIIQLKKYFPCNYQSCDPSVLQNNNWFDLITKVQLSEDECDPVDYSPDFKKRRIVPKSFTLNYDELVKEKQYAELSLEFHGAISNPVTLSPSAQYLQKITYLSLTGNVRYSSEFFKILFQGCVNLVTLNVEAPVISPCSLAISKSIQTSKSIKNFRLKDKRMNFNTLFSALSECETLENIHLYDTSNEYSNLADPATLIEKCANLYYLFIFASMTDTTKSTNLRLFRKFKSICKRSHLYVELHNSSDDVRYTCDPYVDVFKLIPIRLCIEI